MARVKKHKHEQTALVKSMDTSTQVESMNNTNSWYSENDELTTIEKSL